MVYLRIVIYSPSCLCRPLIYFVCGIYFKNIPHCFRKSCCFWSPLTFIVWTTSWNIYKISSFAFQKKASRDMRYVICCQEYVISLLESITNKPAFMIELDNNTCLNSYIVIIVINKPKTYFISDSDSSMFLIFIKCNLTYQNN